MRGGLGADRLSNDFLDLSWLRKKIRLCDVMLLEIGFFVNSKIILCASVYQMVYSKKFISLLHTCHLELEKIDTKEKHNLNV